MIPALYDTFKHWSAKGSVYVFSDTHFNDEDCVIMSSNWISPDEQVEIINKLAHKNDTLVLLGDVGDISYVKKLKAGHKVLIMGNHDEGPTKFKEVFDEVYEGPLFISEKILLSHERIDGLDFCVNLHGHDHSKWAKDDATHINLAANVRGFKPISLGEEIKKGLISRVKTIHRETIDKATKTSQKRKKKAEKK
jgi:calcineurin-like phosphoesterase family protein